MFKKKKLEFEIVDNKILNVLDFDWYINKIKTIYIDKSFMDSSKYAIYISTGDETDKLYFETSNLKLIAKEFQKLCKDLVKVNPNFEIQQYECVNKENLNIYMSL